MVRPIMGLTRRLLGFRPFAEVYSEPCAEANAEWDKRCTR
jgi:hypothetical protein